MAKVRARNQRGNNNPKNKKKNHKKQMSPKKNKASSKKSTPGILQPASSNNRSSPPWQVMSKKDQAKNAQALKAQREQMKANNKQSTSTSIPKDSIPVYSADMSKTNELLSPNLRSLLSWKRFKPSSSTTTNKGTSSSSSSELTFIGSYLKNQQPPQLGVPEIAFLGRSNVGKSSLLNKLVSSQIARVGKTPGATASVNLYCLSQQLQRSQTQKPSKPLLGLVDLPGFGYAKLSKEIKESVEVAAERYLNDRMELALGILLVDMRRTPSQDDKAILAALYDMGVPLCVVATKVDKLNANDRAKCLEKIQEGLGLPENQPLVISSVTGEGVKDLWRIILDACEEKIRDLKNNLNEEDEEDDDWWENDDDSKAIFEDGEDMVYDQGYDWVHGNNDDLFQGDEIQSGRSDKNENVNFYDYDYAEDGYYDDHDYDEGKNDGYNDANEKMLQNQQKQAMMNEAMKLKNLKKIARKMDRAGEV